MNIVHPSSIQISLRLHPQYYQELQELAEAWSDKFGQEYTVQDLVRKSIEVSFNFLSSMARPRKT